MTTPHLIDDIKRDEGCKLHAYPDPESPMAKYGVGSGEPFTIGYGHCGPEVRLGLEWTQAQCEDALAADIGRSIRDLDEHAPWWRSLCDARQDVLANMCFNLGWPRLSGFKKALAACRAHDYETAAKELLASKWAEQVKGRARRLAEQLRTGERVN